jgi:hypothetical protein
MKETLDRAGVANLEVGLSARPPADVADRFYPRAIEHSQAILVRDSGNVEARRVLKQATERRREQVQTPPRPK